MKNLFLVLFGLAFTLSFSQDSLQSYQVGYYFDMGKSVIDGYLDLGYQPHKTIDKSVLLTSEYLEGYYIDIQGKKNYGNIRMSTGSLFYFNSAENTIESKTTQYIKMGNFEFHSLSASEIDRWTVIRRHLFAELINDIGDLKLYKFVGANKVHYYLKSNNGLFTELPSSGADLRHVLRTAFSELKCINALLNDEVYSAESLMKMLAYQRKHEKGEYVYFDAYWNEIEDMSASKYHLEVKEINGRDYVLSFFQNDGVPLFEGTYSVLEPNKMKGKVVYFYPDGNKRKEVEEKKRNEKDVFVYHHYFKNGNKHLAYYKKGLEDYYEEVYNLEGKSLLDKKGNGVEVYFDDILDREITINYEKHRVNQAYYTANDGEKISLVAESKAYYGSSTAILESKASRKIEYPLSSVENEVTGLVVVRVLIDKEGNMKDFSVVKGLSTEVNLQVNKFFDEIKLSKNWKPAKMGKEHVAQEQIIAIDFSIEGRQISTYRPTPMMMFNGTTGMPIIMFY